MPAKKKAAKKRATTSKKVRKNSSENAKILALALISTVLLFGYITLSKNNEIKKARLMEDAKKLMTPKEMTVNLSEQNSSKETGTMTLKEIDDNTTEVTLTIKNAPKAAQPAHIHEGACPKPEMVVYPLTDVVNGSSKTTLAVSMSELLSGLPLAVNVHKSKSDTSTYVSCGDITLPVTNNYTY